MTCFINIAMRVLLHENIEKGLMILLLFDTTFSHLTCIIGPQM